MFVDGRFSAPSVIFKSYLGEDTIYNFINSLVEESTYCTDVMKKHFKNSAKCWICDNGYADDEVKLRDHCHVTEKYRGSVHRDCNITAKLEKK